MLDDPLLIIIVLALLAVGFVLARGIGTFGKGGDANNRKANRLMWWRIGLQALAVALILGYLALRGIGGFGGE